MQNNKNTTEYPTGEYNELVMQIRTLRESAGMSLYELADLTGISAPALSLIERGMMNLTLKTLKRIATALKKKVEIKLH